MTCATLINTAILSHTFIRGESHFKLPLLDCRPGVNCIGRWQIFSILPIAAPAMGTASADSWKNWACNLSVLFTPITMPILLPGFINAHVPYFFLIDLRREPTILHYRL
jgi:hypothetical protein